MTPSFLIGIIDDDIFVRTSLADLLRASGFRTTCFECAEEFLESTERSECAPVQSAQHSARQQDAADVDKLERAQHLESRQ